MECVTIITIDLILQLNERNKNIYSRLRDNFQPNNIKTELSKLDAQSRRAVSHENVTPLLSSFGLSGETLGNLSNDDGDVEEDAL